MMARVTLQQHPAGQKVTMALMFPSVSWKPLYSEIQNECPVLRKVYHIRVKGGVFF